jgi:hypothetical protein
MTRRSRPRTDTSSNDGDVDLVGFIDLANWSPVDELALLGERCGSLSRRWEFTIHLQGSAGVRSHAACGHEPCGPIFFLKGRGRRCIGQRKNLPVRVYGRLFGMRKA